MKKVIFLMIASWCLIPGFLAIAETNIDIGTGMVHLNTKADYDYIKQHLPEVYKSKYQTLLNEKDKWLNTKKLAEDEVAVVDKTHRVTEVKDEITGEIKERYQQEYKEDPNSKLLKLGFTVEKVTIAIKDDIVEAK